MSRKRKSKARHSQIFQNKKREKQQRNFGRSDNPTKISNSVVLLLCPYCGCAAEKIQARDLFGQYAHPDHADRYYYSCTGENCDARVGVHESTGRPLGTMAKRKLRKLRSLAHESFDLLWKDKKRRSSKHSPRKEAYNWLIDQMGLARADCHMSKMDAEQCLKVIEICKDQDSI